MNARPTGAILSYPVISALPGVAHEGSFQNLFGDRCEELRHTLSLENCVGKDTCPCFVWHTTIDSGVPVKNSLLFADALTKQGIYCELHLFPEADHGKGLAEDFPGTCQWPILALNWMERVGKN